MQANPQISFVLVSDLSFLSIGQIDWILVLYLFDGLEDLLGRCRFVEDEENFIVEIYRSHFSPFDRLFMRCKIKYIRYDTCFSY